MKDMKETLKILLSSLLGYALWLALAFYALSGAASAQTHYEHIVDKDGLTKATEYVNAIRDNIRPELHSKLAPYVSAIRYAENGGKGREYGILHKRVKPTYRSQAGWCAATVQKNYDRWVKAGSKGEFVVFLGKRYCPVGAKNDPNGLNKHWIKNVRKLYAKHSR